MKKLALTLLAAAVLGTLAAPAARANITTSGNYKTGTPTPTFTLTAPFTLTITTSGSFWFLALDEWVTNDFFEDFVYPSTPQSLSYRINGGAVSTVDISALSDNYTGGSANSSGISANDGLLNFSTGIAVTAGQTVTFLPGTLTFGSGGNGFNAPPAAFNGNVFLADFFGAALTAHTSVVPEPGTWAAVALGAALLGVVKWRRRDVRA